jgi:hypothetical protein
MGRSDNGTEWDGWYESKFGGNGGRGILCAAYGGGRFVIAGDGGKIVYIWDDGGWSDPELINQGGYLTGTFDILAAAHGLVNGEDAFVIAGTNGNVAQTRGTDSKFYAESNLGFQVNGLTWGKGLFVAVGGNKSIVTSPDTYTWTQGTGIASGTDAFLCVASNGRHFVAAGEKGLLVTGDISSTSWNEIPLGTYINKFTSAEDIKAIAYGGGKFVAAAATKIGITPAGDPIYNNPRILYWYQKP